MEYYDRIFFWISYLEMIPGAALIMIVPLIYFLIRKDKHIIAKMFIFFGALCSMLHLYALFTWDEDISMFWIQEILHLTREYPFRKWAEYAEMLVPVLAAAFTWLAVRIGRRWMDRKKGAVCVTAVCLMLSFGFILLANSVLYGKYKEIYQERWSEYVWEKVRFIEGKHSDRDFSYFVPVQDEENGTGFQDEYGEEILPCQFDEYGPAGFFNGEFRMVVHRHIWTGEHSEMWYYYLIDGKGKLVGDGQYDGIIAFDPDRNMIVARRDEFYGAIDGDGEEILPFQYEYPEILEAAGIDDEDYRDQMEQEPETDAKGRICVKENLQTK